MILPNTNSSRYRWRWTSFQNNIKNINKYQEIAAIAAIVGHGPSHVTYLKYLISSRDSMKTYNERIELAEKLLRANKSYRYIISKTNFTPNKISEIKKKLLGIDADPKHTQAYRSFHFGEKGVLEVALELGLTQEQSEKYYLEYW